MVNCCDKDTAFFSLTQNPGKNALFSPFVNLLVNLLIS